MATNVNRLKHICSQPVVLAISNVHTIGDAQEYEPSQTILETAKKYRLSEGVFLRRLLLIFCLRRLKFVLVKFVLVQAWSFVGTWLGEERRRASGGDIIHARDENIRITSGGEDVSEDIR